MNKPLLGQKKSIVGMNKIDRQMIHYTIQLPYIFLRMYIKSFLRWKNNTEISKEKTLIKYYSFEFSDFMKFIMMMQLFVEAFAIQIGLEVNCNV